MKVNKKTVAIITILTLITTGIIYWRKRIVRYAKGFVGQSETYGNMSFNDPGFQRLMEGVNWNPGDQWCVYFAKVVWINKFKSIKDILQKLISGNSQVTYSNFTKDTSGLFSIEKYPKAGDIVIWQYYGSSGAEQRGHGGVVTKAKGDIFDTVEGNTKLNVAEADAKYVGEKVHNLDEYNKTSGLKLRGFIRYKFAS